MSWSSQLRSTERPEGHTLHVSMKRNRRKVLQAEIYQVPWTCYMGCDLKPKREPGVKMEEIRERETQTAGGNNRRSAVIERAFTVGCASVVSLCGPPRGPIRGGRAGPLGRGRLGSPRRTGDAVAQ